MGSAWSWITAPLRPATIFTKHSRLLRPVYKALSGEEPAHDTRLSKTRKCISRPIRCCPQPVWHGECVHYMYQLQRLCGGLSSITNMISHFSYIASGVNHTHTHTHTLSLALSLSLSLSLLSLSSLFVSFTLLLSFSFFLFLSLTLSRFIYLFRFYQSLDLSSSFHHPNRWQCSPVSFM